MAEAATLSEPTPLPWHKLRVWGLFTAIIIYALWGTPTPDRAGFAEFAVGVLLVFAAGVQGGVSALRIGAAGPVWQKAAQLLLAYGLVVPLLSGVVHGNGVAAMARDIIPFLFLLMPLFIAPLFSGEQAETGKLTGFIAGLGIVFSLRVLLPYLMERPAVVDPFMLGNAPTVLFAALLLIGLCGWFLYGGDLFKSALCLLVALVPLAVMALIIQRASVGAVFMSVAALAVIGLVRRPLRVILPLGLCVLTALAYAPVIGTVLQELAHKNELVGFNMRWQEAQAVLDALGGSVFTVLLGKGWGASVASPAVGGMVVNFTHSLITTYWLKTGLVGVLLVLFYLYRLGLLLARLFFRNPVVALALTGPLAIDVLLYASFKSLDFGLVLLLVPLWAELRAFVAKKQRL